MGSRGPPMGDLGQVSHLLGCEEKSHEDQQTLTTSISVGLSERTGKVSTSPISEDTSEVKVEGILVPPISEETLIEETQVFPILKEQSDLREEGLNTPLSVQNSEEENLEEKNLTGESLKGETVGDETLVLTISEDQPDLKVIAWEDFRNSLEKLCESHSLTSQLHARREELAEKLESSLRVIHCITFSFFRIVLPNKIYKNDGV